MTRSPNPNTQTLPQGLLLLLAVGAGLGVANVYYIQPGLHLVQQDFGASTNLVGWIPTLTQIGYAFGMLLLAPLGDVLNRRNLILGKACLLFLALVASALAPNLACLALAGIAIGLLGSIGQDFIPIAAQLAPDTQRGRIVGTVTTGLLTGILLSRTLGGLVAQGFGWRAIYVAAAGLMLLLMLALLRVLPSLPPSSYGRYRELLGSLLTLWQRYPRLRYAVRTQALLASSLGAFWSTLALVLAAPPFHQGPGVAGAYGLAGAAGALAAPLFGRVADHVGPIPAIQIGCLLVAISFAAMWVLLSSLIVLAIGAVLFDLGVMAALVSHQTIVNGLDASARSRLNGMLMTGAMFGMAAGAGIGTWAWTHMGWTGICILGLLAGLSGLALSLFHRQLGEL